MTHDELISTVNNLIETCKDGAEGFKTCSADASDPPLKDELATRAQSCVAAARELQDLVVSLGGKPAVGPSLSGTLHRRWMDIKATILGKDDDAILKECERGEDLALRSYRRALDKTLPPEVSTIAERQYHGVLQNYDAVKKMRDQHHARG